MKSMRVSRKIVCWLLIALTGAIVAAQQTASNQFSGALRNARLYTIVSSKSLDKVNRNDVRAALKVWFDTMARQKGFALDSKVDITDSVGEIRARLGSHSVDVIVISVPEYLEMESGHLLIPSLTHARIPQGVAPYSYVLVVNPSSPPTLAGLRGKNALVFSRNGANTGSAWLDVLFSKEKLGRAASFFGSVASTETSQACILPVFFGRADACVVDEINLELAVELNPQLKQLRVIARSRPLLDSLLATPVDPYPYRKELFDILLTLQEDPRGRQLLLVFKTNRLVPLAAADLDTARELWRDYERLSSATPTHAAAPTPVELGREKD